MQNHSARIAKLYRLGGLLFPALLAMPAAAQTLVLTNPSDRMRPQAVVDVPVADTSIRSVRIGSTVLPAQYLSGSGIVRFVASFAPHQVLTAILSPEPPPPAPRRVQVVLNVQDGGSLQGSAIKGGTFRLRDRYTVPSSHFIHDGLIAFEGIGWESDRVAYRLYLDARNVPDLFGKFGSEMVFQDVGHGFDDYQYPRAWGGDIYKVGDSLGMGGIGLWRNGKATQIGSAVISAKVLAQGPVTAAAEVDADTARDGDIHAIYAITAGTAWTEVRVTASRLSAPLVAGLAVHSGDKVLSAPNTRGWSYIAVWGPQEHGPDGVGTALFFRSRDVDAIAEDGSSRFVQFRAPDHAEYAFAGRWVQEGKNAACGDAVADEGAFAAWLETMRADLDAPIGIAWQ